MRSKNTPHIDGIALAGLFLIVFLISNAVFGKSEPPVAAAKAAAEVEVAPLAGVQEPDSSDFAAPYDSYVLTQGPHGFSYGHAAIDLSGGKGSTIRSPIHGIVQDLYIDWLSNTTLVLQNERYQVTLMHGLYSVTVGDHVSIGDPIGTESNQGNTVDWQGRSCAGRNCGYHTHLNVFDFNRGENVNPLELFPDQD